MKKMLVFLLAAVCLLAKGSAQTAVNTGNHRVIFVSGPPSPVGGMAFWFSGDCVTYVSSVCGALSNGASVATWADRSGNANNLTRTSSSSTCISHTNQLNSLPAVTFNGDCVLTLASTITASSGHTLFLVMKSSGGYVVGSGLGGFAYGTCTAGTANFIDRQNIANIGAATNTCASSTWFQSNVYYTNLGSGGGIGFRMNSATDTTASTVNQNISANGPSGLGQDIFGNNGFFNGQVVEVIYYNSTLSLPQIQQNEAYLRSKYGIS